MPEYIMLFNFTAQGIGKIKEGPNRIENMKKMFEKAGAKAKTFYLVLGRYDTVCIADAPDDDTIAKLMLQIGSQGNVHSETLRAFSEDQFKSIVKKLE